MLDAYDTYSAAAAKVNAKLAENTLYNELIKYSRMEVYKEELRFLAEMPYEQGHEWVRKCFAEFMDLNALDPENFPMDTPIGVVRAVRAHRKEKNKLAKLNRTKKSTNSTDWLQAHSAALEGQPAMEENK